MNSGSLKPFQPGQSGNPAGRPKKLPGLDKLLAESWGKISQKLKILEALVVKAKKGHVRSEQLILDRTFGKEIIPLSVAVQSFDISKVDLTQLSPEALDELLNLPIQYDEGEHI